MFMSHTQYVLYYIFIVFYTVYYTRLLCYFINVFVVFLYTQYVDIFIYILAVFHNLFPFIIYSIKYTLCLLSSVSPINLLCNLFFFRISYVRPQVC